MARHLWFSLCLGAVLTLLLSACEESPAQPVATPNATAPAATSGAAPPPLSGKVLVYYKYLGGTTLVVYTVSPGSAPVERFRVKHEDGFPEPLLLVSARNAVLVPMNHSLVLYDLASGTGTTIWSGPDSTYVARAAVSPDGSRVALSATASASHLEGELSIVTLNIDGSDVQTIISAPQPFLPDFRGLPVPVGWWPDNSTIVYRGMVPTEAPTSLGISGADGSDFHALGEPLWWWLSPDGRLAVRTDVSPGLECPVPGHALLLLDLATGTERELVHVDAPVLFDYEWSPDGKTLLYGTAGETGGLTPGERWPHCPEGAWQWRLLDISTGERRPVPSPAEAHRLWTGVAYEEGPSYLLRVDGVEVSSGEQLRILGVLDVQ
jgi:Tol biopolymer transport system component